MTGDGRRGRGMDRNLKSEVIRSRSGGSEVEYANIGVGRDAGEDIGGMRRKGCGIGAAVRGERNERLWAMRGPNAHGTVPTRRTEAVFCYEIPVYAKDLAIVFSPTLDGEVV